MSVVKTVKSWLLNQIPTDILENKSLNKAILSLPKNYSFEIHKTLHQIIKFGAKRVALQFPEGLLMYSCIISDIIEEFCKVETLIMGDVTYGACCIDDYTARAIECDFMVHYGHSCLIPVSTTAIKTLYIFVDISIDLSHFCSTVRHNFKDQKGDIGTEKKSIALVSTIQFASSLNAAKDELLIDFDVIVPQSKPLSQGEILGCTAPKCQSDVIIYIGDGRFHLEAMMIANPEINAFKYDPYTQRITKEEYNHDGMLTTRKKSIHQAKTALRFGLILGTLGRQGNTEVLDFIKDRLESCGKQVTLILLSEIFPSKLELFDLDCFVQVACPRLSIDWGSFFDKPLLTPYELMVVLGEVGLEGQYPMDYYSKQSLGPWTPNNTIKH